MGKLTDRMAANIQATGDQLNERMREALKPNLEPDEELRAVLIVKSFKLPAPWRWLLSELLRTFLVKTWYVGITPERVLFGRMKAFLKPDPSGVIAVPLADVTVRPRWPSGAELVVTNPKGGLPTKFTLPEVADIHKVQALLQA
jgi:hypothetical protein